MVVLNDSSPPSFPPYPLSPHSGKLPSATVTPASFGQSPQTPAGFVQPSQTPSGFAQASQTLSGFAQPSQTPAGFVQSSQTPSGFAQASQTPSGFIQSSQTPAGFAQASHHSLYQMQGMPTASPVSIFRWVLGGTGTPKVGGHITASARSVMPCTDRSTHVPSFVHLPVC